MKQKKIQYAIDFLTHSVSLFQCPQCGSSFTLKENSLVCHHQHNFNLSKKGIVHFPNQASFNAYDREMLTHRRAMIQRDLYHPLLLKLSSFLNLEPSQVLVDMGSGEGSYLNKLNTKYHIDGIKLGFDLSKDGVELASDYNEDAFWFVGDVTNIPLRSQSVDYFLNIFSPIQYKEVQRVLKKSGYVVKVVPNRRYLIELRHLFFDENKDKQSYSNQAIVERFRSEMTVIHEEDLTYRYDVEEGDIPHILKMSPLHWQSDQSRLIAMTSEKLSQLTIDVKLLIGRIKDSDEGINEAI